MKEKESKKKLRTNWRGKRISQIGIILSKAPLNLIIDVHENRVESN
jgi:hypothetical protein